MFKRFLTIECETWFFTTFTNRNVNITGMICILPFKSGGILGDHRLVGGHFGFNGGHLEKKDTSLHIDTDSQTCM